MKIACIGMSHLGLVTSLSYAIKGNFVVCFDTDDSLINDLISKRIPIEEPYYTDLLTQNSEKINFSRNLIELNSVDLIYITKDVVTDEQSKSSLSEIYEIITKLSAILRPKTTIVILSQVPPGFMRNLSSEFDFDFVYQVETLIFGKAVARALNPEQFIIGVASKSKDISLRHKELLDSFHVPIILMNYESAELTKIAINMFLAASISTTNSLAEICEHIGANWSDIKLALQLDKRIGEHAYLNPGLGISGGNLERDVVNIIGIATKENTHSQLFKSFQSNSNWRKEWPSRVLKHYLKSEIQGKKIAVWGLAYKRDTNSVKNSPSVLNIRNLLGDFEIHVSDPKVKKINGFDGKIIFHEDPLHCLEGSEALLILTDWTEYTLIKPDDILTRMKNPLIIDPYGIYSSFFNNSRNYFSLGQGEFFS